MYFLFSFQINWIEVGKNHGLKRVKNTPKISFAGNGHSIKSTRNIK